MAGFELQEWIGRSQDQVFATLFDTSLAPAIVDGVTENEQITAGPVGLGTRFRETRLVDGKEGTTELEVVDFEPHQLYGVSGKTDGITVTYRYHLSPEEDGTRIKLVCDVTAKGIKKALVPVVVGIMKKEDGSHLANLKDYLQV